MPTGQKATLRSWRDLSLWQRPVVKSSRRKRGEGQCFGPCELSTAAAEQCLDAHMGSVQVGTVTEGGLF